MLFVFFSIHWMTESVVTSSIFMILFSLGISWEVFKLSSSVWPSILFFLGILGGLVVLLAYSFMLFSWKEQGKAFSKGFEFSGLQMVVYSPLALILWILEKDSLTLIGGSSSKFQPSAWSVASMSFDYSNHYIYSILFLFSTLFIILFSIDEIIKNFKN
uniref:NADH dehydrogenase subunit 6 n=1 Tax=Polyplax asiatica TaxID=1425297 RepID=V9PXB6_9NEOP|nr:NADH dehydrogenase subunit 6 [Polyplax asiatica]